MVQDGSLCVIRLELFSRKSNRTNQTVLRCCIWANSDVWPLDAITADKTHESGVLVPKLAAARTATKPLKAWSEEETGFITEPDAVETKKTALYGCTRQYRRRAGHRDGLVDRTRSAPGWPAGVALRLS